MGALHILRARNVSGFQRGSAKDELVIKSIVVLIALCLFHYSNALGQWVQLNGPYGAGVVTMLGSNVQDIFAGTYGHISRSTDNGTDWIQSNSDLPSDASFVAFMGNAGNLMVGGSLGVLTSTDEGMTWIPSNTGLNGNQINSFVIFGGDVYAGTPQDGVYRSTDGGNSWGPTGLNPAMSPDPYVTCLAASQGKIFAGTQGGLLISSDTGKTWIGNSWVQASVQALAVNDSIACAVSNYYVYVSIDAGASWNTEDPASPNATGALSLALVGHTIFVGTFGNGVYRSTDEGVTWAAIGSGLLGHNAISLLVSNGDLYAGTEVGVFRSTNNGGSWTPVNSGLTPSPVRGITVNGGNVYAATDPGGLFLSQDDGTDWSLKSAGLVFSDFYAVESSGRTVLAGTGNGLIYYSTDDGTNWSISRDSVGNSSPPFFLTSISSFAKMGSLFFAGGTGGVTVSTDSGRTWTMDNSGFPNGTNVTALTVLDTFLLAGTNSGGGVFLSTDWSRMDTVWTNHHSRWNQVSNGFNSSAALCLASIGGELFTGSPGGIFVSQDTGAYWRSSNNGLLNPWILDFAVSGSNIFAATEGGAFLSTDEGAHWTPVNEGFTDSSNVLSIAVSKKYLFAGTVSTGIWRRLLSDMIVVAINEPEASIPNRFSLSQNYPNPFNPSTVIIYQLPVSSHVTLKVYDVLGRLARTLVDERESAGSYSVTFNADGLVSGVYFYRLQAGPFSQTKKLIIIR